MLKTKKNTGFPEQLPRSGTRWPKPGRVLASSLVGRKEKPGFLEKITDIHIGFIHKHYEL